MLTRLLDPSLVDPFAAVYAYCRWADDLADEHSGSSTDRDRALSLLAWWRDQTIAWHRGDVPVHPVFVALASASEMLASPLPLRCFLDLIDAFEQDQRVTRYQTWDELLGYCSRSANPVGRLILALGGEPDAGAVPDSEVPHARRDLLEQSDALCTALQLTNFWQDVRRDLLDRDRVYLPRELTGLDDGTLRRYAASPRDPAARVPFILAVRPLVERTRALFRQSAGLHELAPRSISTPIWLFHAGGLATLRRIEATGCTTLWNRPALSRTAKATLVARAFVRTRMGSRSAA